MADSLEDLQKENKLVEVFSALSLARNALLHAHYTIGLFVGPCSEFRETEFVIMQIDRVLEREGYYRS